MIRFIRNQIQRRKIGNIVLDILEPWTLNFVFVFVSPQIIVFEAWIGGGGKSTVWGKKKKSSCLCLCVFVIVIVIARRQPLQLQEWQNETIEINNSVPSWLPCVTLPWQRFSTSVCVCNYAPCVGHMCFLLYASTFSQLLFVWDIESLKKAVCIFGLRPSTSPWTSVARRLNQDTMLQHLAAGYTFPINFGA